MHKLTILLMISLLFLTSCWDQLLLKDARLVYGISFDLEEDESIFTTAVIRSIKQSARGAAQLEAANVIISAKGNTLRETRTKLDQKIGGELAPNKVRIFVLGEELAQTDIYPVLDILYRDPRSALGSKIIIAKGRGEDIMKLDQVGEVLISEEILELVRSAERNSFVSKETVQSICTIMFDPGEDFYIPIIKKTEGNLVEVLGMALFNGRKYSGKNLIKDDATLFLLLKNQRGKLAKFTLEVNPEEKNKRERFISIQVKDSKSKIHVKTLNKDEVSVIINLKLKVDVMEYPKDQLANRSEIIKLNHKLSTRLTEKAIKVVNTLQEANSDAFGIGRDLISFHPEVWDDLDWKKDYPNILIEPRVEVEITGTGIIK